MLNIFDVYMPITPISVSNDQVDLQTEIQTCKLCFTRPRLDVVTLLQLLLENLTVRERESLQEVEATDFQE